MPFVVPLECHSYIFLSTILGKHFKSRRRHSHALYKMIPATKLNMFKAKCGILPQQTWLVILLKWYSIMDILLQNVSIIFLIKLFHEIALIISEGCLFVWWAKSNTYCFDHSHKNIYSGNTGRTGRSTHLCWERSYTGTHSSLPGIKM